MPAFEDLATSPFCRQAGQHVAGVSCTRLRCTYAPAYHYEISHYVPDSAAASSSELSSLASLARHRNTAAYLTKLMTLAMHKICSVLRFPPSIVNPADGKHHKGIIYALNARAGDGHTARSLQVDAWYDRPGT